MLRVERAAAILLALVRAGVSKAKVVTLTPNLFLSSNATRKGRRQNRGVLIRLVPAIKPERVTLPAMESGSRKWGLVANRAIVKAQINRSLSRDEILRVAFSIFARQSIAFEAVQKTTDPIMSLLDKASSFSEEDLPSNHISFYRAAYGFTREQVCTICDVWDTQRSLAQFKGYKFQKNRTFYPLSLPVGGVWPTQLSTIQAVQPGESGLYDIVEIFLQGPTDVFLGTGVKGK